ncbi:MAG: MBL fold metallo-hydrolase [Vulcanimicrobiota bacterium]
MVIKFFGTRGSIPVSGPEKNKFGGNTTSLMIESDSLPRGVRLVIDTGSGFVPLSYESLHQGIKKFIILYTHYHYDHTIGLTLAPVTFIKSIEIKAYGPQELGVGPGKMMEMLFKPPFFPVDFKELKSHFKFKGIEFPNSMVMIIHRDGGTKVFTMDQFENFENNGAMIPFNKGCKYKLEDCLVIKMHRSNHPERTISYRIEERKTGKVFVFLTDHENQDGIPQNFLSHINQADLLVMDAQYDRERYDKMTAGFGHGTPDYCVKTALAANARMLGLTHHDPTSTDDKIEFIVNEAKEYLREEEGKPELDVFACKDYQEIELN